MTHSQAVRERAIELLATGMAARAVARELEIGEASVRRWSGAAIEGIPRHQSVREQIMRAGPDIVLRGLRRMDSMIGQATMEQMRDVAYCTRTASDIVLDWTEGRKSAGTAGTVTIDARQQVYMAAARALPIEELERLALIAEQAGDGERPER